MADDDDDFNEDDIPGFSHPGMALSPQPDKGKNRARELEQLASPSENGLDSVPLSGNIGSSSGPPRSARQTIGGIQVETRYVYFFVLFDIS